MVYMSEKKSLTKLAGDVEHCKEKIEECNYFCDMLEAHKDCDWKWFHIWRNKNTEKGSIHIGNNGVCIDASFPVQKLTEINPNLEEA